MKKYNFTIRLIIIFTVIFHGDLFAQSIESNNWVFGSGARIEFDATNPTMNPPLVQSSSINQIEGVATMSDASGNLLFYTDGQTIWNSLGIAAVTGLFGDASSTQSAIIVPDPEDDQNYYVFTVDLFGGADGLQYVIYTPSTSTATPSVQLTSGVTEKISAVRKGDQSGYWIVAHDWLNNHFLVYELNCSSGLVGINQNQPYSIQPVGASHEGHMNSTLGYMKLSPDGSKLAIANTYGNWSGTGGINAWGFVQIFEFDDLTGMISTNPNDIKSIGLNSAGTLADNTTLFTPYGLEFSSNSDFLYIGEVGQVNTNGGSVYQYALSTNTLLEIGEAVGNGYDIGALQMGRDGKIYIAIDQRNYLGVIQNPDVLFTGTILDFNTTPNQLDLGSSAQSRLGLPNFVQSLLIDNGSITVSGEPCDIEFNYSGTGTLTGVGWDFGDGSTSLSLNPTHNYASPGTYSVTLSITTVNGCPATLTTVVISENCCYIDANTVYDLTTNNVISSDLAWDNKVYIADNVIVTVDNNAILDITNVDVIFGECAGIDFTDGAKLRSNNSVYRTCDPDKTWRGISFYSASPDAPNYATGIVNECTFKNAQQAFYAHTQVTQDLRITNNLFSNCKVGVDITNGEFLRSITGNTFLLDDLSPEFEDLGCSWGLSGYRAGIRTSNVNFVNKISQNDFILQDQITPNFYGVDSRLSNNIVVSDNNFTDLFRSITLFRNNNSIIESNEVSIGNTSQGYEHQIAATSCTNTLIVSNDLTNTDKQANPVNNAAIYCAYDHSYGIKENNIEGFATGIQCERAHNVHVIENTITDGQLYGVYLNELDHSNVFCNTINMDAKASTNIVGIGYFEATDGNHDIVIGSNCIFETNTAIHLESSSFNTTIPVVKNNFLYNYSNAGIENINLLGNIGSSSSPSNGAGRNSFISNNGLGLTGDILTNTPSLISYGNYGVSFISSGISIMGNNVNSTASCGLQIDLANSSNGYIEVCDDIKTNAKNLILTNNNLAPDFESEIVNYSLSELVYVMGRLRNSIDPNAIDYFHTASVANANFTQNESKWFDFNYYKLINDFQQAKLSLQSIIATNQNDNDLIFMEKLVLDLNIDPHTAIIPSVISELETIASNNGDYAHLATAILTEVELKDQFDFYPTKKAVHSDNIELLNLSNVSFTVYPNPTDGLINFEYAVSENDQSVLKVYDVLGRLVETVRLNYDYAVQSLDITSYASGVYSLTITSNNKVVAHSRIIKR